MEPPPPQEYREYICGQCWRDERGMRMYMAATGYGGALFGMGLEWRPGRSGIAPGSGNHWADGISLSDWSSYGGSHMFRDGLAAGLTAMGNQLYGYANGRLTRVEESNGRIGYWEKYTWLDFTDEDASIGGEQLATIGIGMRFKALGVPSGPNHFVIGMPASERVNQQQTQGGDLSVSYAGFNGSLKDVVNYGLGGAGLVINHTTAELLNDRAAKIAGKYSRQAVRDVKLIDKSIEGLGKTARKLGYLGLAINGASMANNYLNGDGITASQAFDFVMTGVLTVLTVTNPALLIGFGVYGVLDAAGAFDGIKESLGGNTVILKR